MSKRKNPKDYLFFGAVLVLVLVMVFSGLRILESTVFSSRENPEQPRQTKTIIRDGVEYFPRQDITVVLVMGVDQYGIMESSGEARNDGITDMLTLLIFDETNKTYDILALNRDTMTNVPMLGASGNITGYFFGQIGLSHVYGTGMEDSCENTKRTVSELLYNIRIDQYLAMNMDAIQILNDAVGGVAVTITDDFSHIDPSMVPGQMVLQGKQAIHFVRTRKGIGDQLNLSRMGRHREYIRNFLKALRSKVEESDSFVLSAYEQVAPYIVTDCSSTVISSMVSRYMDYTLDEMVSPEGEIRMGEEHYEFYLDEEKLDALILRLFYAEK